MPPTSTTLRAIASARRRDDVIAAQRPSAVAGVPMQSSDFWQRQTNFWRRITNPAQGPKRPRNVKFDNQPWSATCPMKPTTKIRFTEPQIELVMRAHPNCNLDRLTEVSFEFDRAGTIIDCIGTIKDGGNIDHNHAGSGLARLYEAARRRITALPVTATILQFRKCNRPANAQALMPNNEQSDCPNRSG